MNRLLNALAFAAIVIAAFVSDSHLPWQTLVSSPLLARVTHSHRGSDLPVVASFDGIPPVPPQVDELKLERAIERAQAAQHRLTRVEMRRAMERARIQIERASGTCKIVRIDQ